LLSHASRDCIFHLSERFGFAFILKAARNIVQVTRGEGGLRLQQDTIAHIYHDQLLTNLPTVRRPDWLGNDDLPFAGQFGGSHFLTSRSKIKVRILYLGAATVNTRSDQWGFMMKKLED
jgi:hypothetical protein